MMRLRGIYEKVSGSGEWWIRYADATGHIRREKVGTYEEAEMRLKLRKEEAKLGVLPRLAWRRRPVSFRKIAEEALAYSDEPKGVLPKIYNHQALNSRPGSENLQTKEQRCQF